MIQSETLNTIARRYSCRDFKETMPTDEQLDAIAKAALQAPSAMNQQAWRAIVVKDRALLDEMEHEAIEFLKGMPDRTFFDRMMEGGGKIFYHAPCAIIVPILKVDDGGTELDCGIIGENIALAATALGLGNVICGMLGLAFAGKKGNEFMNRLKFPENYIFGTGVLIGEANTVTEPHVIDETKTWTIG